MRVRGALSERLPPLPSKWAERLTFTHAYLQGDGGRRGGVGVSGCEPIQGRPRHFQAGQRRTFKAMRMRIAELTSSDERLAILRASLDKGLDRVLCR